MASGRVKVIVSWAGLLSCVLCGGCLVPYGYPNLSHVPTVPLGPQPADVHPFRVDVTADIVDAGENDRCLLTEVLTSLAGYVPPQTNLSLDYGVYVIGIALNYPIHRGHTTLLRLYRPGYQLVEVPAWDLQGKVHWEEAPAPAAQEKAVDALLATPGIEGPRIEFTDDERLRRGMEEWQFRHLAVGSAAAEHRAALLFAASEYDRIAALPELTSQGQQAAKERLQGKARRLRELVAK